MVVVMAVQGNGIEFKLAAIFESHLAADSVEGVLDCGGDAGEQSSAEILLVGAMVVKSPDAEGGVVVWTGRPGGLNGVAALRIALQVELIRGVQIDVFGVARGQGRPRPVSGIGAVDNSNRPNKVAVVRIASEFNASLRSPQDEGVVGGAANDDPTPARRALCH